VGKVSPNTEKKLFGWRRRTPRGQHAVLVFRQAVIAMCSHMLHQCTAKLRKWLYDLIREVL
jgi:hypothetical protein